jgi:RNA polymerase sigma-70 factor (ECF subfamily)
MPLYSEYSKDQLYHLVSKGDELAFGVLYERHWRKLYRFLHRMTKSKEIAEELMSDVFLKLWIGKELVPEIDNMDAFLFKVAYRKALDFFRIASRDNSLQKVISLELIEEQTVSNESPDQFILTQEYRRIIDAAVSQLSSQRKKVFTLSRQEGMSHKDIALELNLSPKTVKRTISDALSSIRNYLKEHPESGVLLWLFFIL